MNTSLLRPVGPPTHPGREPVRRLGSLLAACLLLATGALPLAAQPRLGPVVAYSQAEADARYDLVDVPEFLDRLGGGDLAGNGGALASGDFDGDGYPELLIGMPLEDRGGEQDSGWVHVVPGGPDGPDASLAAERIWDQDGAIEGDPGNGDLFGYSLAVGHFNDDSHLDLAVGAPGEGIQSSGSTFSEAGSIHIIYGGPEGLQAGGNRQLWQGRTVDGGTVVGGLESGDEFGFSTAAGDFDCNGIDDLAVGVPRESFGTGGAGTIVDGGAVVVFYGTDEGIVPTADQLLSRELWDGAESFDRFGWALAVGRFDDDSCDDLAIGVPGHDIADLDSAGAVDIVYGSPAGLDTTSRETWTLDSPDVAGDAATGDGFGTALTIGDFDADGIDDLAAGLPFRRANASFLETGGAVVLYGSETGLSGAGSLYLDQEVDGVEDRADPDDEFGRFLAAGDLDGDGADELAIGVAGESVVGPEGLVDSAGAVQLFDAVAGAGVVVEGNQLLDTELIAIPSQPDALGSRILLADLDGVGTADLAVTAPNRTVSDGTEDIDFAGEILVAWSPGGHFLFGDGFESGDTMLWSPPD